MSKILSIVWYKVFPPKYGGQKGIAFFLKHLAKSHELIVLCSRNNKQWENLDIRSVLPLGKQQFFDPITRGRITSTAENIHADLIILEHPYHAFAAHRAAKKTGARLIIHSHNIESERFRQFGRLSWPILLGLEKWIHCKADLNLFKTESDMKWAISNFGIQEDKCMLLPYGVERVNPDKQKSRQTIQQRHSIAADERILLFAGTLDYRPNATAVEKIFREIAPEIEKQTALKLKIIICGRNEDRRFRHLKKMAHTLVINAGEVDDIENYFAAADLFIDPVTTGGGVQTKIIEALNFGLNVVCFQGIVDDQLMSLAGDKIFRAGAENTREFVNNISLALQKTSDTPAVFFNYYSWSNIVARFNQKLAAGL